MWRDTRQRRRSQSQEEKDTGDSTTANTTGNLANLTNQEQWMGLRELATRKNRGRSLKESFAFWKTNRCGLTPLLNGMPHET
jgi:hypothetical protein